MSKPYLTFHSIASIHFGPIRDFVLGDPYLTGEPFCTRKLVLTDKDGVTYHFALYADQVSQLQVGVDAAIERHQPEAQQPLPVCADDGKRDPKPDSGDDPREGGR